VIRKWGFEPIMEERRGESRRKRGGEKGRRRKEANVGKGQINILNLRYRSVTST